MYFLLPISGQFQASNFNSFAETQFSHREKQYWLGKKQFIFCFIMANRISNCIQKSNRNLLILRHLNFKTEKEKSEIVFQYVFDAKLLKDLKVSVCVWPNGFLPSLTDTKIYTIKMRFLFVCLSVYLHLSRFSKVPPNEGLQDELAAEGGQNANLI